VVFKLCTIPQKRVSISGPGRILAYRSFRGENKLTELCRLIRPIPYTCLGGEERPHHPSDRWLNEHREDRSKYGPGEPQSDTELPQKGCKTRLSLYL
jgi:hypothetical protein